MKDEEILEDPSPQDPEDYERLKDAYERMRDAPDMYIPGSDEPDLSDEPQAINPERDAYVLQQIRQGNYKKEEQIKELVIARLKKLPENFRISIG